MRRGQSLVEFALIAPVLILLAMAAWDGGSVLREQVVLQQAARDGARVAATTYGGAQQSVVKDAVLASAGDLPGLSSTSGYLTIASTAQSVTVSVQYSHVLITPVLRQLWTRGSGTLTLSASSTFYLPAQTPVPATVVPSTPLPTATPTSTPSPTASPTPAATTTPTATPAPSICARALTIPALASGTGEYVTVQLTTASNITALWSIEPLEPGGLIELYLYAGTPLSGQSDPASASPPANPLASASVNANGSGFVGWVSPATEPVGTYTVYFFKRGASLSQATNADLWYYSGNCA